MAALQNRRHELFAQGLVEGKTADQAYTDAGYTPNRCNASRLKSNENINLRITELQDEHRQRHDVTVDSLTDEFDENRELAFQTAQPAAANGATAGKARLHGLHMPDGPNVNIVGDNVMVLSDLELARRIAFMLTERRGNSTA
jgi:hypothetical protein